MSAYHVSRLPGFHRACAGLGGLAGVVLAAAAVGRAALPVLVAVAVVMAAAVVVLRAGQRSDRGRARRARDEVVRSGIIPAQRRGSPEGPLTARGAPAGPATTPGQLHCLSDDQLIRRWRLSDARLRRVRQHPHGTGAVVIAAVVAERGRVLDEIERRDPDGWLARLSGDGAEHRPPWWP